MSRGGSFARRVGPVGLVCVTALLLLVLATSGTSGAVPMTFTVDSTGDGADAAIDGSCADATGACTLRAAIQESNASLGDKDTIAFGIPAAPLSIAPATDLPDITDPVVIDGTTQDGFVDHPIVELRGGAFLTGLRVTAGDTTIRGLVINSFNNEVVLETNGGNVVAGNFIGTDVTGTQDGGGATPGTQLIVASGDANTIGGATPGDRNVIAGVAPGHLEVRSSDNTIQGNFIGTNAAGNAAVGPSNAGIAIGHQGARNLVGGTGPGTGNLISGNASGILIGGPETIVQGNLIGTDKTGTEAIPNGNGVENSALATRIVGNVISGNTDTGILVQGDQATIQGNLIGPDISGTKTPGSKNAPGNGSWGIDVHVGGDLIGNLIGGTDPAARNVISGNGGGIALGFEASRNRIKGNFIGVDANRAPLGNHFHGVCICPIAGGIATGNVVGGPEAGAANVIAYNRGSGVAVGSHPDFPGHNSIRGNSIHSNGILGIDLVGLVELPDPNDPGDADQGANDLQNFPVLDWTSAGNQTTVTGTLNSEPNKTYRIEFFHNPECNIFPSEFGTGGPFGQGETFLGAIDVDTDAGGDATIPATTLSTATGVTEVITATATSPNGSTSEFSECRADLEITKSDDPDPVRNGQALTYTIDVVNQGPSPALRVVVVDQLPAASDFTPGSITPTQGNCSLFGETYRCELGQIARDGSARITITGTVSATAPDTFSNTASVSSELTDPDTEDNTATAETQVVENQPAGTIVVSKVTVPAGSAETFDFTTDYDNDGFSLVDGESNTSDPLAPDTYSVSEADKAGWDETSSCSDGSPVTAIQLSADETVTCTFTNTMRGTVTLLKTTNGVVDPSKDIAFVLTGPGLPNAGITRSTFGDQDGMLDFGSMNLVAGQTYKICESPVPAGFTSFWKLDGIIVTPYNPDANRVPPEDLGTRCYDFQVAPGQTRAVLVDNSRPGGDPRTIGYWKNWNRCTGGNQSATAAKNGGAAAGFFLVEDLLPQLVGDFSVTTCQPAVKVLAKQTQAGKNKASDAAYELGAQLLAARFNLAAGAETCLPIQQAVLDGQTLLDEINFTGSGDYLGSKSKSPRRPQALALASTIDRYNNGNLC